MYNSTSGPYDLNDAVEHVEFRGDGLSGLQVPKDQHIHHPTVTNPDGLIRALIRTEGVS